MFDINEHFAEAVNLYLLLLLPQKQLVMICHAREHTTSYVLVKEDNTDTTEGPLANAVIAIGYLRSTTGEMLLVKYVNEVVQCTLFLMSLVTFCEGIGNTRF